MWTAGRTKATALFAAALGFAIYASFTAAMLARRHFDPSSFIVAGDEFTNPAAAPANVHVNTHSPGYDGQFYFRLAIAPFSVKESVAGVHFDYPVYRSQRILYPILVYLTSAGRTTAVPWSMIAVNLLAAGAIGGAAALVLQLENRSIILAAVSVAMYPGFVLTMSRDLTELVEISFVLAGAALIVKRRDGFAALVLSAAVLAKEMALIVAIAVVLDRAITRQLKASDALLIVPVAIFVGWKMVLFRLWNLPPSFGTEGHFSLPFSGMWQCIRTVAAAPKEQTLLIVEVLLVVAFTIVIAISLRTSSAPGFIKIACVLYALLFFSLGAEFWAEDWAFLRAATDFGVLGGLVALHSPLRAVVICVFVGGWIGLAMHCVMFR
jgi:hypothetical protein